MGFFKPLDKIVRDVTKVLEPGALWSSEKLGLNGLDPLFGNLLGPTTKGMSAAERAAYEAAKAAEVERRTRLLTAQQRRTRIALGSQGGARSLLFGSYTGTDRPTVNAPLSELAPPEPVAQPAAARRRRRTMVAGTGATTGLVIGGRRSGESLA